MDLYCLDAGCLDCIAGSDILGLLLAQPLRPDSFFVVGPVYVSASVSVDAAAAFAGRIRGRAQEALSLGMISHEEWLSGSSKLEEGRGGIGGCMKSAFAPISGLVRPEVIKRLLKSQTLLF